MQEVLGIEDPLFRAVLQWYEIFAKPFRAVFVMFPDLAEGAC